MHDESPDATLWLEAISGTEASFAVLFDRHRARVFRKAYARVRYVSDAEDIVAMVFLEAWRSRKKVRIIDGSILPWLLTVTTYVSLNLERSTRRYKRLLAALPQQEAVPDLAERAGDRVDLEPAQRALTEAMAMLNLKDQTILELCLVEELSLPDVAALLNTMNNPTDVIDEAVILPELAAA